MSEKTLMFAFDMETTSGNPATAIPVQIGLVSEDGSGERRILMNSLCNPGVPISVEAQKIHGISEAQVRSAPDASLLAWQVQQLCRAMNPGFLITFNGRIFDEPIIDRCGGGKVFEGIMHLDVLDAAFRLLPGLASHKLDFLYRHFTGQELVSAHDAVTDVIATLDVLAGIRSATGKSTRDIAVEMAEPRPYEVMPVGQYKGKPVSQVDPSWARWMQANQPSMRPDMRATVDAILGSAGRL